MAGMDSWKFMDVSPGCWRQEFAFLVKAVETAVRPDRMRKKEEAVRVTKKISGADQFELRPTPSW
jgi:hypothetical protein